MPVIGSLVVALIALGSVLLSARRNAAAMLEAENVRHGHAIEHSERMAIRHEKVAALKDLLDACSALGRSTEEVLWVVREQLAMRRLPAGASARADEEIADAHKQAVREFRRTRAGASAYAEPKVIRAADGVEAAYGRLITEARKPGASAESLEQLHNEATRSGRAAIDRLVEAVRASLGTDNALPDPEDTAR